MPQVQQPYNMFAQQKQAGYPSSAQILQEQQRRVPGQVQGETPEQFAQGKFSNGQPIQPAQPVYESKPTPTQPVEQVQQSTRRQMPAVDPNSSTSGMDALEAMYTSPQEEERLRKSSIANQRIMAVGDALRHIANLHYTANGATPQKFSSPVADEQARYERGKALRDAANYKYMTYQQQKANQEARMKQLSDAAELKLKQLEFNQDKFNRQQSLNEFKAKNDDWYKRATIGQKERALEIQRQLAEGRISLMEAQEALAKVKTAQGGFAPKKGSSGGSRGGGKGMDEYETTTETRYDYDKTGRKTGSTTTKKRTVNKKAQPAKTTKKQLPGNTGSGKKKLP